MTDSNLNWLWDSSPSPDTTKAEKQFNTNPRMMLKYPFVERNEIMNKANYILPQFLAAMLTIALLAGGSTATPILDQSQEQFNGFAAVDVQGSLTQTFTPSVSAQLDHIDLYLCNRYGDPWASPSTPTTVGIFPTDGNGAPPGPRDSHVRRSYDSVRFWRSQARTGPARSQ